MSDFSGFLIKAIIAIAVAAVILIASELLLKRLLKERAKTSYVFVRRFIRMVVLIFLGMFLVAEYWGLTKLVNLMVGSVAIISGIVAFACQSIMKDFFAGLVISINRPFDIGDRIMIPSFDKACVVEEINSHHVVLRSMDGMRYIVPNSKISSDVLTNTSYRQRLRGSFIKVPIGYDSDIPKAMSLVLEAVKECPHTFPNAEGNVDLGGYGDVYLMGYQDSSYLLETVIWTEPETDIFLACSEVYTSIVTKFRANDVEIPYNYLNIIEKEEDDISEKVSSGVRKRDVRIKTDSLQILSSVDDVDSIYGISDQYAKYHDFSPEHRMELRLISEELMLFAENVLGVTSGEYWIDGKKEETYIHYRTITNLDQDQKSDLLQLSSTGKNEAKTGFAAMVQDLIRKRSSGDGRQSISYSGYKKSGQKTDDLEYRILTEKADDIKVEIRNGSAEIIAVRKFIDN